MDMDLPLLQSVHTSLYKSIILISVYLHPLSTSRLYASALYSTYSKNSHCQVICDKRFRHQTDAFQQSGPEIHLASTDSCIAFRFFFPGEPSLLLIPAGFIFLIDPLETSVTCQGPPETHTDWDERCSRKQNWGWRGLVASGRGAQLLLAGSHRSMFAPMQTHSYWHPEATDKRGGVSPRRLVLPFIAPRVLLGYGKDS